MKEEIQIGENDLNIELTGFINNGDKKKRNKIITILVVVAALFLLPLVSIIIVLVTMKSGEEEKFDNEQLTKISCVFDVSSNSKPTVILGKQFVNNTAINILIEGEDIGYTKEYLFNSTGKHNVQFIMNDTINMDYIFKGVDSLLSVSMISNKLNKITSMISSFENCSSLERTNH